MASNPNPHANPNWATGLLNAQGNPMPSTAAQPPIPNPNYSGGPPGSGGDPMIDIAGLKKNVGFLNWVAAGAAAAIIALYFLLADRIGDVGDKVSDVRVEIAGQRGDIKAALDRMDKPLTPEPEQRKSHGQPDK